MRVDDKMDDNTSTERKTSMVDIAKILGSESNVHGISKIAKARSTGRQLFWTVLVVLAFIAASIQLGFILKKYLSYPTTEVTNISKKLSVTFPAVTVCNTNPISMTRVSKVLANNTDMMQWFSFLQNTNFGEHDSKLDSHQAFYENLPEAVQYIAHSFDDMVLSCRFKNADCGIQNFSLNFDGKNYYNCFTFAVNENQSEEILQNNPGPDNGLSLILSLGKESSPPGSYGIYDMKNPTGFSGGMRVQIHNRNTVPTPFYHGFDIPPGYSSSVGLKARIHSRLPKPYGDCTTQNYDEEQNHENTVFTCLQQCQQKILVKICGCKTSALPVLSNLKPKVPFCSEIKNWKHKSDLYKGQNQVVLNQLLCEQRVIENLRTDRSYEDDCGCSEPCKEMSYEQSLSMLYWPEEFYQLGFLSELYTGNNASKPTELVQEALDILNITSTKYSTLAMQGISEDLDRSDKIEIARASAIIRQNFMRLNVFLQDLRVTEHIQIPVYDLSSLFSDIGGTLILWLGFSMLTFMEAFELIMSLILLACNSDMYIMGDKSGTKQNVKKQEIF
ncbi:FMRFamide-activated amiloride-sensitive sodium channel-like [Mercenaria mercenaria]|uniref:FMRFamide-activated amiloride-sensitive sodium channel-like n=1 Tax=Mercenaria mercenaria TaxID=6596 RepID=UPI00234E84AD|nr:FMRFamide-activated amiloride-sensitive sodium channel-like [Mercenaria mercenaria]